MSSNDVFERTSGFKRDDGGFTIVFENGFVISVKWSPMNYCTAKLGAKKNLEIGHLADFSCTAEVAIHNPDGSWMMLHTYSKDGDSYDPETDVVGWVSPDGVALLMGILADSEEISSPWFETERKVKLVIRALEKGYNLKLECKDVR